LNRIRISLCPITPPQNGKTKHHWGSKRNKCQVATLYKSYISSSNGKRNANYTSHHRMVGMWLYKRRWQRLKWKDLKTSNVENHVQVIVGRVKIREGIKLERSQGFGLDELDV
jgi:hypothetical protein